MRIRVGIGAGLAALVAAAPAVAAGAPAQTLPGKALGLSVAADGTARVALADTATGSGAVAVAPPGGAFGPPTPLAALPEPDLVGFADDGGGVALSASAAGLVAASFAPDGTPLVQQPLALGTVDPANVRLAVAPDGSSVLAWVRDGRAMVSAAPPGGPFAPPHVLAAHVPVAHDLSLAAASGGDAIVAVSSVSTRRAGAVELRRAGTVAAAQAIPALTASDAAIGPDGTAALATQGPHDVTPPGVRVALAPRHATRLGGASLRTALAARRSLFAGPEIAIGPDENPIVVLHDATAGLVFDRRTVRRVRLPAANLIALAPVAGPGGGGLALLARDTPFHPARQPLVLAALRSRGTFGAARSDATVGRGVDVLSGPLGALAPGGTLVAAQTTYHGGAGGFTTRLVRFPSQP